MPSLPKICSKPPRTQRGADRQYNAILRAYIASQDGGGAFGYDWPTFRLNWPEGAQRAADLITLRRKLPE